MQKFDTILAAAERRHGEAAMVSQIESQKPRTPAELAKIPEDRWLSQMTKCVFQAGFNWKVVEAKWTGFEEAFDEFDVGRWVMSTDDDLAALVSDERIIRNGMKIKSVPENARFIAEIYKQEGGFGKWIGEWPSSDLIGLLETFKKRGGRLGGMTSQYFLRFMNVEGFILSRDVTAALIHAGIVDKQPTSKKAMNEVQNAFNHWKDESGYSLTQISRVLAMSIDG